MYITEKYWGNYIGDTDDSLTLVDYLAQKQKKEIPLSEIFSDFGLDELDGNFAAPERPLAFTDADGFELPLSYAIDLVTDLAALLLECKVNGGVDLHALSGEESDAPAMISVTATPDEHALINETLADFSAAPLSYDLCEMASEEDMQEMAALCEALRKELYES